MAVKRVPNYRGASAVIARRFDAEAGSSFWKVEIGLDSVVFEVA